MNRFTRFFLAAIFGAGCWAAAMHWNATTARAEANYAVPAPPTAKFIVRTMTLGSDYLTYRVDASNGTVWYVSSAKWMKIVEDTPPGAGVYDIQLTPTAGDTSYSALRTDLSTGRVWYLANGKFNLFTEP